jgi:hypothetical protein
MQPTSKPRPAAGKRLRAITLGKGEGGEFRLRDLDPALGQLLLPVVTVPVLAEALDLTPRRVQQLTSEGVLLRADRGRYPFGLNVRQYCQYLRDGGDRDQL